MQGVSVLFLDLCGCQFVRFFKSSIYAGGVGPISRSMRVSIRSFFESSIYAGGGRGDVAGSVDVCGVDVRFVFNLDLRRGSLYSCIGSSVVHVVCQFVHPLAMSLSSIVRPSVRPRG